MSASFQNQSFHTYTSIHTEINKFFSFRGEKEGFSWHLKTTLYFSSHRACLGLVMLREPEKDSKLTLLVCLRSCPRSSWKRQKFPSVSVCVCQAVINHPRNGACVGGSFTLPSVNGKRFGETKNMQAWGL